jgi:hypothetical protein
MATTSLYTKLHSLTNQQLIRLSSELRRSIVPEDALIREVIKDTEVDTTAPILAFVAVGTNLNFVLADRLIMAMDENKLLNDAIDLMTEPK